MTHLVSSWFVEQALKKFPDNIKRKFLLGTSDYSNYVMKWPSFKNEWNKLRPTQLTIQLANEDKTFNFLKENKLVLNSTSEIQFGFTHPQSGDELISLFIGKTDTVKYSSELVDITIMDKFKQLTERVVGSSDVPVEYVGSNYLPADIAWWLITSYGGFSTVKSSSNPDIDYDAWLTWWNVFSADSVFMNASFDGQKINECLRKIGRHTYSALFVHGNRITFNRFTLADTYVNSFNDSSIIDLSLEFSGNDIINKQYIFADYDQTSDYHQTTVFDQDLTSINSYGLRENNEKDDSIWYVGSGPALNAAQRVLTVQKEPYDKIEFEAPLIGILRLIGETVTVVDTFHGIDGSYRVMQEQFDTDKGLITINADRSQVFGAFILDTSTLDGPDILI